MLAGGALLALWPPSRRPVRALVPDALLDRADAVMGPLAFDYGRRPGRDPWGNPIDRDPGNLDPTFARTLQVLFTRLRARGFQPVLQEGRRSEARARALEAHHPDRTSGLKSTHLDGAAADVIDSRYGFTPGPQARAFFAALEDEAVKLGLHRLFRSGVSDTAGRNDSWDSPHVQLATTAEIARTRGRPGALASLAATRLSAFV